MSKAITSAPLAQVVERGKPALDRPIAKLSLTYGDVFLVFAIIMLTRKLGWHRNPA